MILEKISRYNSLVGEVKALEPKEERIVLIEDRPIIIKLVDDKDIQRLRERNRTVCIDMNG